jgi:hypothetical protein
VPGGIADARQVGHRGAAELQHEPGHAGDP